MQAMKKTVAALAVGCAAAAAGAADLAAGAAKAETCAACHGPAGVSKLPETPSLAGQPEGFLQWQLVYFRGGRRKSPVMQPIAAALSDDDIRNLAAHFAKQKPPPPEAAATDVIPAMRAVGQRLAQGHRCASCHTDDYSGTQATPRLAGQREDYLLKALREFKSGARTGGGVASMADVVYPLGDDELRALAHFTSHPR
jgi:cytochrome c553